MWYSTSGGRIEDGASGPSAFTYVWTLHAGPRAARRAQRGGRDIGKRFADFLRPRGLYSALSFRLIFWVGMILFVSIAVWAYYNIQYKREEAVKGVVAEADRLGTTIKLGTHYAMMLNSRDEINQIIKNIGRQEGIENIRIYNKAGQIKFSNRPDEVDRTTNIKAEACDICHRTQPPRDTVDLNERIRIFESGGGFRLLGIISPIYNEPGCATDPCHVHPDEKKVLGGLDVVVSLEDTDRNLSSYTRGIVVLALVIFLGASGIIAVFLLISVNRPIKKLISETQHIGKGEYPCKTKVDRGDEIGQLADAINQMGEEISEKQEALRRQKEEYQNLFELAPCYITVQDRNLQLINYNREFSQNFDPVPGDFCYRAYKSRSEPCEVCPVMRTFEDGQSHYSEEEGINKDGTRSFWIVRTAPIRDAKGEIIGAMELCLDITRIKHLEEEARRSEEKYRTIFNTIPNPVFVLDAETLEILDCNDSVAAVYGLGKKETLGTFFLELFDEDERAERALEMKSLKTINHARQIRKDGHLIYVNIRISRSDYLGREVLLVTTSDITARLLAEQHLIQASKMATLGEMATGVAHELNQPLSVIKTASSFLHKKAHKKEAISDEILKTMTEEIVSHVDRASRIINHMREFGRKSDVKKERVQVNEALNKALEIFSQQLKLREIEVVRDLEKTLPPILADANRLEQVFINLLINARDAIEEKRERFPERSGEKKIFITTRSLDGKVVVEVRDTGVGIPKSILDRIFDPFFTTKQVGRGTGLGLSISYGIVKDYDGTIDVETRESEGANFIIQFPMADKD